MKKLIFFISVFILMIIGFIFIINKAKDYEINYKYEDYEVIEKYNVKDQIYSFTIKKDDIEFYYILEAKYSKNRKLVKEFKLDETNQFTCGTLNVNGNILPVQCLKDKVYYDESYIKNIGDDPKLLRESNSIQIYNDDYKYYVWNKKGIYNINDREEYNFLKKESYTNNLSYTINNYIIFADYDSTRTFNKFYIYDNNKKKIDEWKLDFNIYFDSYFMGDYDGYVYLFDRKDKNEYRLDITKKKIKRVSNLDGGKVYQGDWQDISLEKLVYNDYLFSNNKAYNYEIVDNQLYLVLYKSKYKIKVFDKEVQYIFMSNKDKVFFLSGDSLYSFDLTNGSKLLLKSFEWNFSHENKLFIFE